MLHLRLLETTDVHSNLLPFDYYANEADKPFGLARVATLIRRARRECDNVLLFDNGDFLQGTPISDITAQPGSGWGGPHPAVLAMNALGYDAACLGNHEFNFGLEWLEKTLTQAEFPITCANVSKPDGTALFAPHLMLERTLTDTHGQKHDLKIGVIGLVPPQVTVWDQSHLRGQLISRDILDTARAVVPGIRAAGADIVIALAHCGIDASTPQPMMENAALPLGLVPGVDAILAGHSHQVFPNPSVGDLPNVDFAAGTLNSTPAVMAGFRGSHLGVLDLELKNSGQGWQVTGHRARAHAVELPEKSGVVPADPDLCQILAPAHAATVKQIDKPIGHSQVALHSYLALVRSDPAMRLVTQAQRAAVRTVLADTPYQDLPILSATAPFKTGGRGGPEHYTDIPAGALSLRHAAGLYSFPNTLCALLVNGAQVRDWLERAVICFNQLTPGQTDQPVCDPTVPGHVFDIIDGLSYQIDLSQPARYRLDGHLSDPSAKRIRNIRFHGQPLADTDWFILATNNYRAFGAGPYAQMTTGQLIHRGQIPISSLLAQYIRTQGVDGAMPSATWQFSALPRGTSAYFDTGPGVRRYPKELNALNAVDTGDTSAGFCRLRLSMSAGYHVTPACESIL